MNRANQHALFQATNQGLLGIRQAEINYYVSLNSAFGTQAALIGGFTYGIFTQEMFDVTQAYAQVFRDIYWIASSATIAAAVHGILSTMLLQTLGPGLALHGPVGSMVRACEGMREEQKMVTFAFAMMMVLFSLSTLMLFWAVMTIQAAAGSTFVWVLAVRFYYFYCERIYLRFYWKQEEDYLHRDDDDKDPSEQYTDGPKVFTGGSRENPMHARPQSMVMTGGTSSQSRSEDGVAMTEKSSGRRTSLIPSMRLPFSRQTAAQAAAKSSDTEIADLSTLNSLTSKDILMQGYILMKRPSRNSKVRKSWKRCYFILNGLGHFFYYRNRQEYREKPEAPKRKRPLSLSEFHVTVWRGESLTDSKTKGASSILFQFLLSPKDYEPSVRDTQETMQSLMDSDVSGNNDDDDDEDEDSDDTTTGTVVTGNRARTVSAPHARKWAMRCDTEEELNMWLDAMREVAPMSFSD